MDGISVFISYSSVQKKTGGRLKQCLVDYCGYSTFLAHEDIEGGTLWEEAIYNGIEQSDIFIPLLSHSFKSSDFADQEIGIAVCLKKKIIPIKLEELNPYGFINKYQALIYKAYTPHFSYPKDNNTNELALTIGQIGLAYNGGNSEFHRKAINSLIYAFIHSGSYSCTNAIIQLLRKCTDLTRADITRIKGAIKSNPQISGAFGLSDLNHFLHNTYEIQID